MIRYTDGKDGKLLEGTEEIPESSESSELCDGEVDWFKSTTGVRSGSSSSTDSETAVASELTVFPQEQLRVVSPVGVDG
jgi:hypothetical protein